MTSFPTHCHFQPASRQAGKHRWSPDGGLGNGTVACGLAWGGLPWLPGGKGCQTPRCLVPSVHPPSLGSGCSTNAGNTGDINFSSFFVLQFYWGLNTIKRTQLKCAFWWVLTYVHAHETITMKNEHIHPPQKFSPSSLYPYKPLPNQATISLLFITRFHFILWKFIYMEQYVIRFFGSRFFHSA